MRNKPARWLAAVVLMAFAQAASALLPIQAWQTSRGARVLFVENHDIPMLDVSVDFPAGSGFDTPEKSGAASMTNNLLRAAFAFHGLAHHGEVVPILPQFTERVGLFETRKIPYVIAEGERAAEEQLPYLRRLLAAR